MEPKCSQNFELREIKKIVGAFIWEILSGGKNIPDWYIQQFSANKSQIVKKSICYEETYFAIFIYLY